MIIDDNLIRNNYFFYNYILNNCIIQIIVFYL